MVTEAVSIVDKISLFSNLVPPNALTFQDDTFRPKEDSLASLWPSWWRGDGGKKKEARFASTS
eukprot:scaffold6596_cov161-Amphora_coffeaeformis.AAC.3